MIAQAIEMLRDRSLPMLVEQEIERVILSGEYAPGDKINETALALRFGISRGPIREALRSLDRTGLIATIPNRGVFVRRLTAAEAADIYDVRAALFALAGQCLAVRASEADVACLRGHVAAMDAAVARDDFDAYIIENFALHDAIVTRAGNPTLATHYRSLVKQLRLYRTRNLMLADSVQASNAEHRAMVEAIAAHDPARAYAAHFNHVATAKTRLMASQMA